MKKIEIRKCVFLKFLAVFCSLFLFQCDYFKIIEVAPLGLYGSYPYDDTYSMSICDYEEIQRCLFSLGFCFEKDVRYDNRYRKGYVIDNFILGEEILEVELDVYSKKNGECTWVLARIQGLVTTDDNVYEKKFEEYRLAFEREIMDKINHCDSAQNH